MAKQYAVVTIANRCIPIELVGKPTIRVRPLDGHLDNGVEPEMVIPYADFDAEGIAKIGGRTIPVQTVGEAMIRVRPIDGHLGDGREPEMEVDYLRIVIVANEDQAMKIADKTNYHIKEVKAS